MTNLSMTRYGYTINGLSRGINSQESVSIPRTRSIHLYFFSGLRETRTSPDYYNTAIPFSPSEAVWQLQFIFRIALWLIKYAAGKLKMEPFGKLEVKAGEHIVITHLGRIERRQQVRTPLSFGLV